MVVSMRLNSLCLVLVFRLADIDECVDSFIIRSLKFDLSGHITPYPA